MFFKFKKVDDYSNMEFKDVKEIKVLGSGCKSCMKLEENTKEALKLANLNVLVSHITDFDEIAKYGVLSTPALVIDNEVKSMGEVLSVKDIIKILAK